MRDLDILRTVVQHNCNISDALFAREYSLCIYLLKMREYFRWEMGYGYGDPLPEKQLGEWLTERERLWERIEDRPFTPIPLGNGLDPFDSETINHALVQRGLIYGAGYGVGGKPHFFLARLERVIEEPGIHILVSGTEYARDITAPPAMSRGPTLYVRRASLRRLLWERLEEWRWRRHEGPMARLAGLYDFEGNFTAALDAMTDMETQSAILHERGEQHAGTHLGPSWEEMLAAVPRSRTEYVLRAVRDHLADCAVTLPTLVQSDARASLHFYFANLTGMRRAIFPSLVNAYEEWNTNGNLQPLNETIINGERHWLETARSLLAIYQEESDVKILERTAEKVTL